jgi:hypothetical protein
MQQRGHGTKTSTSMTKVRYRESRVCKKNGSN